MRLCDGALVVVDAAEGVCIQTHSVLKQARAERVAPCLVINKIDRLATELGLDAAAAHERLALIVDEANAVLAALASAEFLAQADDAAEAADLECAAPPASIAMLVTITVDGSSFSPCTCCLCWLVSVRCSTSRMQLCTRRRGNGLGAPPHSLIAACTVGASAHARRSPVH